jgi:MFS family permease
VERSTRAPDPAPADDVEGATAPPTASGRFPALASPRYRRFLASSMVATVGGFMLATSQGWLVLQLTDSPAGLGLVGAATNFPTLFLAVVAGVVADRVDRRRLLVAASLVGCALVSTLAALTTLGVVAYWHVVLIALLFGVVQVVQLPTQQAFLSSVVDRTAIGNAVALNSAQYNLSRTLAPAVAGLLIAAGGLAIGFWVDAVALAVVAWLLAGLRIPASHEADRAHAALWQDLQAGVRYVAGQRVLAALVLLPAVPALLVLNYLTFMPVYARDILGIGPAGLGLLNGSVGVGALVGALALATLRPSGGSGRLMLAGLGVISAMLVTFATSRWLPLSMASLAVLGTFQVMFYSTTNTLIQVLSPARLRGRILSLYALTSIGLIPVANLAGGAIAESVGVTAVLAVGGGAALVCGAAVALAEPRLAGLRAHAISSTIVDDG